jgi:hypothetical protein
MTEAMLGYCGLSCAGCTAYIAKRTDDHDLRIRTAKEWGLLAFRYPRKLSIAMAARAPKERVGHGVSSARSVIVQPSAVWQIARRARTMGARSWSRSLKWLERKPASDSKPSAQRSSSTRGRSREARVRSLPDPGVQASIPSFNLLSLFDEVA